MKYYIDTEFLEGPQTKTFFGIKTGMTKPTIDLISIGIVSEDGREYYAISKDFNLKEAWNRFDWKQRSKEDVKHTPALGTLYKEYWLRDNVLLPIFKDLAEKDGIFAHGEDQYFTYKVCKRLLKKYGKSNKDIAYFAKHFIYNTKSAGGDPGVIEHLAQETIKKGISFYAYYADYDWVVFCWLFGNMMNLPKCFPMYCRDLKQIMDDVAIIYDDDPYTNLDIDGKLTYLKTDSRFPKQENEHSALDDAKWNLKLHQFLNSIQDTPIT